MTVFLFVALSLPLVALDLTVSRISVTGTETTDPSVVRAALIEVEVGRTLDERLLEEAVERARGRLLALGYFGSVDVVLVRSKTRPGTAAIVVEVTEGYPFRFGGGPIWARVGRVNVDGFGTDLDLKLGWNLQEFIWVQRRLIPGWTSTVSVGNRPLASNEEGGREDHGLGVLGAVAKDWGWGWQTGLAVRAEAVTDPDYHDPQFRTLPGAWALWSRVDPGFSPARGLWVRSRVTAQPGDWTRLDGDARAYLPLGAGLKTAFRVASARVFGRFERRDGVSISGLDAVRKPVEPSDVGQGAAWGSMELRWGLGPWDLGFTSLIVEPAAVVDGGLGWSQGGMNPVAAAGLAVRIWVGAPVFLPLRCELTWDQARRWTLGFGASAPF